MHAPKTRTQDCWIESFIESTDGIPSPLILRKWSGIVAVGAALERRVYLDTAESKIYPNLFVLLVAPPGVGKTMAIRKTVEMWQRTQILKVAPDDITKASLLDAVAASHQVKMLSATDFLEYNSLQIGADELGVLIPAHDMSVMSVMNKLYDNVDFYKESRRGREEDLEMRNPQISLLAGTQPDFLASLLPPEAWGMGFMSRMIMIYAGKPVKPSLFTKRKAIDTAPLLADLKQISSIHGEVTFSPDAEKEVVAWYEDDLRPVPQHLKLKHYVPRRILNLLKLCIISSVSRSDSMIVELEDFERAKEWLLEAEALIPEIFKDMAGKSDRDVIQDLHGFVWGQYMENKKAPVHKSRIMNFLLSRTPAYNAENLLKACVSAKVLIPAGMDLFIPGTTTETGFTD